jgi:hypothetical protein
MTPESAAEYGPYRRALQGILAVLTISGILYLLASIALAVFSKHKVNLTRSPIHPGNPTEMLICQGDVERLFHDLNERTFTLPTLVSQREANVAQQWDMFSKRWRTEWQEVGERCRFLELRDRGLGTAFDRLAYSHADLEDVELKFAALLRNYIDQQMPHIEEIRRNLDESRKGLERARDEHRPGTQPGGALLPQAPGTGQPRAGRAAPTRQELTGHRRGDGPAARARSLGDPHQHPAQQGRPEWNLSRKDMSPEAG